MPTLKRFSNETIPGASYLSDVAAAPDGEVYVADSGLGADLQPTGNDADEAARRLASYGPNELVERDDLVNAISLNSAMFNLGTVGKASPVWADGKIFAAEVNGQFHVLRPEPTRARGTSTAAGP